MTHVALANTRDPPAMAPPPHDQPIPRIHATVLSSFGADQASRISRKNFMVRCHPPMIFVNILPREGARMLGVRCVGRTEISDRAMYTALSCVLQIYCIMMAVVMNEK